MHDDRAANVDRWHGRDVLGGHGLAHAGSGEELDHVLRNDVRRESVPTYASWVVHLDEPGGVGCAAGGSDDDAVADELHRHSSVGVADHGKKVALGEHD